MVHLRIMDIDYFSDANDFATLFQPYGTKTQKSKRAYESKP